MAGGYTGKILYLDLSAGVIQVDSPDEKLYRDFIGGYGLGARILFSRQKPGTSALGPDNILGFVTGPCTGTPALFGARYCVMAKSPLTGTWGDANSGGDFGPYLKFAGYDAVFVCGISQRPVYLLIEDGKAELRDAAHLWGKDTWETEEIIRGELGPEVRVACIGPSGESLSLIAAVMNDKGRAAGRSGLGAVMGSKRLKAVVVKGTRPVPVASRDRLAELRRRYLAELKESPVAKEFRDMGTVAGMARNVASGEAPVKNWGGAASVDFPDASAISDKAVIAQEQRRYGCWRCPVACGGLMRAGGQDHEYRAGVHKPEYETAAAFGSMCLNDNLASIIKANDICNRYGLDTISAGATIAFAIECYENGLITKADTDGIELGWGDHRAIVAMTEKLARREGFGDVLADGVKVAAQRIGRGAEEYAMHIQGQEVPYHDPKRSPAHAPTYKVDATPARHTQGHEQYLVADLGAPAFDRKAYGGRGPAHKITAEYMHVVNSAGLCLIGSMCLASGNAVLGFLNAVTGWELTLPQMLRVGERVANIRQAFTSREGLNPLEFQVPGRVLGIPPQQEGRLAGRTVDIDLMVEDYFKAAGWDMATGKPGKEKLLELGLDDVAGALWPG